MQNKHHKTEAQDTENNHECCHDSDMKHPRDENNHHHETSGGKDYYTCPMHPEIKQDKPGKCPKCGGMDLVKQSSLDSGESHHDHSSHDHSMAGPDSAKDFLRRFFIVTALLVPLFALSSLGLKLFGYPEFTLRPLLQFAIATVVFYFGLVFFQHASHEIKAKKYGMMTLVSIAVGAGYLFSAASTFIPALEGEFYLEISTLIWVLLFGHYLEAKSTSAAGDALSQVAKLLPKKAHLVKSGNITDVDVASLKAGDTVQIKPGEKVPADGTITKGAASFNESHLTGESKPVSKKTRDSVVAGAICTGSTVTVKLNRVGEHSTIGQIQKLISQAAHTKPKAQALADRAAGWLTLSALSVAIIASLFWFIIAGQTVVFSLTLAIAVLVIACPHALGLAIPAVSSIATKLALNNGIFIKDLSKIEIVKKSDWVVFDKTGTLTEGKFQVHNLEFAQGASAKTRLLSQVFSLESNSHHPIAEAITTHLKSKAKKLSVTNFKDHPGKGISAKVGGDTLYIGTKAFILENKITINTNLEAASKSWQHQSETIAHVGINKKHLLSMGISDGIKPEATKAVSTLHELGLKVAMLTGDNQGVAKSVASKLKIDTYFAQVLPGDKYKHVKKLQHQGGTVIMVGDGVNDAPALKQADVGVAIGAGTDVAVEAGDVVLTQNNPADITKLIILSRKVYSKMIQNLVYALGYNVIAIPAAAGLFIPFGFRLTPQVGAFIMSLSTVVVAANALTLRKAKLS